MWDILFWVAIAFAALWLLVRFFRWASKLERPPEPRQTVSTFTDNHPSIKDWQAHGRAPDKVEHEFIFLAPERRFEYELLATWYNRDPYAESDVSTVHKRYDVRRGEDGAWEIRLVMRNYSRYTEADQHPWEPAPKRLVRFWEAAYLKVTANDSTVDSEPPASPSSSE